MCRAPFCGALALPDQALCRSCLEWQKNRGIGALVGIQDLAPRGRFSEALDRDDKSGYRLACRPIAMVETQVLEVIRRNGGQPLHLVVSHLLRSGVPERETMHALVRLVALGALSYDLSMDLVVASIPPRRPWYRRLASWCLRSPPCWLIACVGATTAALIAFA